MPWSFAKAQGWGSSKQRPQCCCGDASVCKGGPVLVVLLAMSALRTDNEVLEACRCHPWSCWKVGRPHTQQHCNGRYYGIASYCHLAALNNLQGFFGATIQGTARNPYEL